MGFTAAPEETAAPMPEDGGYVQMVYVTDPERPTMIPVRCVLTTYAITCDW